MYIDRCGGRREIKGQWLFATLGIGRMGLLRLLHGTNSFDPRNDVDHIPFRAFSCTTLALRRSASEQASACEVFKLRRFRAPRASSSRGSEGAHPTAPVYRKITLRGLYRSRQEQRFREAPAAPRRGHRDLDLRAYVGCLEPEPHGIVNPHRRHRVRPLRNCLADLLS
jgi:hypothetical protein